MHERSIVGYGLVAAGTLAWLAVPVAVAVGPVRLEPLIGAGALVVLFATGVLAWWQRPGHPAAWRLLLAGTLIAVGVGLSTLLDVLAGPGASGLGEQPAGWAVALVATAAADLGLAALLDLFCSFPDGRYPSRPALLLAGAGYLIAGLSALLTALHPRPPLAISTVSPATTTRTPFGGPIVELVASWPVLDGFLFWFLPVALVVMVVRFRGAGAEIRAQLRWPMAGAGVLALVVVTSVTGLLDLVLPLPDAADQVLWAAALSAIPLGLLVGIVRHRLFDLDLALRRSTSYALLWVLIAAVYAVLAALPGVAAADRLPRTTTVLVTIVAAMAFQPLRRLLERWADRLVFGERIAGYTLIRRFGTMLEESVPATDLASELAATARDGLQAQWSRVWALAADGSRADLIGTSGPVTTAPALATDLTASGEHVGRLECGPRRRDRHTSADAELLHTLGRQAALAMVNAQLTGRLAERITQLDMQAHELASSRARIVAAEATARRRLERDIHDGVQQQLVSLMTSLSVARTQLLNHQGSDAAAATLDVMQGQFRQAVTDLRDLASGIHPAVLTDQGLIPAVEALAARLPLPVTIEYPTGTPTPRACEQVEAAAYFGVAESLTNVVKHADARQAGVHLRMAGRTLTVEVCDDGAGFDTAAAPQRGLAGLRDRLEALGGTLDIRSGDGGPTTIRMLLPTGTTDDG